MNVLYVTSQVMVTKQAPVPLNPPDSLRFATSDTVVPVDEISAAHGAHAGVGEVHEDPLYPIGSWSRIIVCNRNQRGSNNAQPAV